LIEPGVLGRTGAAPALPPPGAPTPKEMVPVGQKYWHVPVPNRPTCPVCKKAVYSRAGIHPQCAMSQAEAPRPVKPNPPEAVAVSPAK
jgi:hypothetical protein